MNLKSKRIHLGVLLVSMFFTAVGHSASSCESLNEEIAGLKQAAIDIAEVQKALFNPTSTGLKSFEGKRMYSDLISTTYAREQAIQGRLKFLTNAAITSGCQK